MFNYLLNKEKLKKYFDYVILPLIPTHREWEEEKSLQESIAIWFELVKVMSPVHRLVNPLFSLRFISG